jgi:hypothetical protein
MFNQDNIINLQGPNKLEIKDPTPPQDPAPPTQPGTPRNPRPIDEEKNPNNPKPIDDEEPQDPRKQTPILEDIPNPNTNNNPGDNWDPNHPIRPVVD